MPLCTAKLHIVKPVAIHMKMNMYVPTSAWMLRSDCASAAYLKAKLMTVPMIDAARVRIMEANEKMESGRDHHRDLTGRMGETKIMMKLSTQAVRKKPNMICEVMRKTERMVVMAVGIATVAPERSSFRMTSTGLNQ